MTNLLGNGNGHHVFQVSDARPLLAAWMICSNLQYENFSLPLVIEEIDRRDCDNILFLKTFNFIKFNSKLP